VTVLIVAGDGVEVSEAGVTDGVAPVSVINEVALPVGVIDDEAVGLAESVMLPVSVPERDPVSEGV